MKTLLGIEEDSNGNVTGAVVADESGRESVVTVPAPFPRAELRAKAPLLAKAYGITLPAEFAAEPEPEKP